jgi:L-aspartate oxidase
MVALTALAALPSSEAEPGPHTWETTNLLHLGQALAYAAHLREETRGGHLRSDFPDRDDDRWLSHQMVTRSGQGVLEVTERPADPAAYVAPGAAS